NLDLRERRLGQVRGRHVHRMPDKISQVLEPIYTGSSTTWQYHLCEGILVAMSKQSPVKAPVNRGDLDGSASTRPTSTKPATTGPASTVMEAAEPRQIAALRRRELAGFLRSRRERIAPELVGLPPASRRRTPGLRREEVATLAGVGVTGTPGS